MDFRDFVKKYTAHIEDLPCAGRNTAFTLTVKLKNTIGSPDLLYYTAVPT